VLHSLLVCCVNEILACALDIAHHAEEENKMNKGGL